MKTIRNVSLALVSTALILSCTEQPYWEIPKDANGDAIITQVSETTSPGITALDDGFTINAYLPNAKPGDVMKAELVKPQVPSWDPDGATQILPVEGTKKEVTVDDDLEITVSYSREEATLANVGDYVTVTLAGATESGILRIDMKSAFDVSQPQFGDEAVSIVRSAEVANFTVNVTPANSEYTGEVVAKRKNGINGTWTTIPGGPFSGPEALIPIAGSDFIANDTMYYSFTATSGENTEEYTTSVVVIDPYFFVEKKGVKLDVAAAENSVNLLSNTPVAGAAEDANLGVALVGGSLVLQAGPGFTGTTEFVPTTVAKYTANKAADAQDDFAAGTPTATADPSEGEGAFIYKVVNGPNPEDVYYGYLKVSEVIPGSSVTLDYRIGDQYAHLATIN